jgi:uncharacterized protein (DUF1015 family)
MAEIIPFRGVRYNPHRIIDISAVVTQPYDRIGEREQTIYYGRSPYNIVRIIKGRPAPGDNGENVYTRAAAYWRTWLEQGLFQQDTTPSLYVYHQRYTFEGVELTRKGVIVLGKLEPEKVHAHERTLKGPKEDRLRLMRATEANFGHIFMLYSDPARRADKVLAKAIEGEAPTIEAKDDFENQHTVWQVSDSGAISQVQAAIADKDLYIADGHHRYETAVNFMQECRAKGWKPVAPESFDVRMMTLFNIDEPGMTIRPIHRLVHGVSGFDAEAFFVQAEKHFLIDPYTSLDEMKDAVKQRRGKHTFGCYTDGRFATLTLRDERTIERLVPGEQSPDWKRLDVAILHTAILERLLGIDAVALEEQWNITYTRDPEDAVQQVDHGDEQLFFLVNPPTPDEVRRVANHGEKMPQKSTDFYPKLLSGLVFSKMEIAK